jgi:hypothetical protein
MVLWHAMGCDQTRAIIVGHALAEDFEVVAVIELFFPLREDSNADWTIA